MSEHKLKIGITQGDINGIGYEVILKALDDSRMLELCTPIIYGSAKIAAFYTKACGLQPLQLQQIPDAADAPADRISIINVVPESTLMGKVDKDWLAILYLAIPLMIPPKYKSPFLSSCIE